MAGRPHFVTLTLEQPTDFMKTTSKILWDSFTRRKKSSLRCTGKKKKVWPCSTLLTNMCVVSRDRKHLYQSQTGIMATAGRKSEKNSSAECPLEFCNIRNIWAIIQIRAEFPECTLDTKMSISIIFALPLSDKMIHVNSTMLWESRFTSTLYIFTWPLIKYQSYGSKGFVCPDSLSLSLF